MWHERKLPFFEAGACPLGNVESQEVAGDGRVLSGMSNTGWQGVATGVIVLRNQQLLGVTLLLPSGTVGWLGSQ